MVKYAYGRCPTRTQLSTRPLVTGKIWRRNTPRSPQEMGEGDYSTVGVPKNGLPKNGQAGISLKNKNDPTLEKWVKHRFTTRKHRLLWKWLLRRHCWLQNDSTSTVWSISDAFPVRHASSRTVCALHANLRDSKMDWKIRTRLAGVVKNKNDPGWDRLPHVLRHPTVLYGRIPKGFCPLFDFGEEGRPSHDFSYFFHIFFTIGFWSATVQSFA